MTQYRTNRAARQRIARDADRVRRALNLTPQARTPEPDEPVHPDTLSTVELCDITGFSYRQLDYWVRLGRLRPRGLAMPGSGVGRDKRRFDYSTLRDLGAIAELTRAGVALHRAWEIVGKLRELAAWDRVVYVDGDNRITDVADGPVTLRVDLSYLDTAHDPRVRTVRLAPAELEDDFVLARLLEGDTVVDVVGWLPASEAKQAHYWRADLRYPAFVVPADRLLDLDTL